MLNLLKGHKGEIEINGIAYKNIDAAIAALDGFEGKLTVTIKQAAKAEAKVEEVAAPMPIKAVEGDAIYRIKVRQYMIKPATKEFDFHTKWNNDVPMPMRIMVGRKLKETRGMVQMELWGEITDKLNSHCMKCGRTLTNPVSKFFGIGPECGGHGYNNPFDSDAELNAAVAEVAEKLRNIKWAGWVIKSAIEEETYLENRGQ